MKLTSVLIMPLCLLVAAATGCSGGKDSSSKQGATSPVVSPTPTDARYLKVKVGTMSLDLGEGQIEDDPNNSYSCRIGALINDVHMSMYLWPGGTNPGWGFGLSIDGFDLSQSKKTYQLPHNLDHLGGFIGAIGFEGANCTITVDNDGKRITGTFECSTISLSNSSNGQTLNQQVSGSGSFGCTLE